MTHRLRSLAAAALLLSLIAACSAGRGTSSGQAASPTTSDAVVACPETPEPETDDVTAWRGQQDPSLFPSIIDPGGTLVCGENRMMFSFLDASGVPIASPDRTVQVDLFDLGLDSESPALSTTAEFIWAIEGEVGVYIANVAFPASGLWGAQFTTSLAGAEPEVIRVPFDVRSERSVIGVGDRAPASDTPTLADVGGDISKISTDDAPVPAFYETSVADALAEHRPFVLAFATPKFCATAQCGPTLDRLKPIAAANPGVTFINVEPYELEDVEGQLQPVLSGDPPALTPTATTAEWGLPSEPWVFVVDRDGIVRGSFMLIFGDEELSAAVEEVAGPPPASPGPSSAASPGPSSAASPQASSAASPSP
ncbi:MAG TPA: hypothetical protein VD763_13285 [Candidatus Saccharimonadales bacterium]|nr:hypothetical protein [Candidatus Saccharimonadales bacterium]